jgi:hypothetical protein
MGLKYRLATRVGCNFESGGIRASEDGERLITDTTRRHEGGGYAAASTKSIALEDRVTRGFRMQLI